jgi:hypothetical protein
VLRAARNIAILMAIALVIVVVPGGGTAAGIVAAVLSLVAATLIAYFVARLYRERRVDIYGLGDLDRGLLYVAIAGVAVLLAASQEFDSTGGTLVEILGLAVCVGLLIRVYEVWRSY